MDADLNIIIKQCADKIKKQMEIESSKADGYIKSCVEQDLENGYIKKDLNPDQIDKVTEIIIYDDYFWDQFNYNLNFIYDEINNGEHDSELNKLKGYEPFTIIKGGK